MKEKIEGMPLQATKLIAKEIAKQKRVPLGTPKERKKEEHRVIPGRSLKAKDIMQRLNNGTLKLDRDGQYTLDEQYAKIKGKSKIEIARDHVQATKDINDLKNRLQNVPSNAKT